MYTRAAAKVEEWIRGHIVLQIPLLLLLTPRNLRFQDLQKRTRRGFIGAGQLEDYSAGIVFRHEHTLSGPKADRLNPRHTRTHTGQLFMLYSDPHKRVDAVLAEAESAAAPPPNSAMSTASSIVCGPSPSRNASRPSSSHGRPEAGHRRQAPSLETALLSQRAPRLCPSPDPDAAYERAMMTFVNIAAKAWSF
jgi:hypothetical protein